jgi:glutamate-1-semialdehyde 2,1-aminomutase
VLFHPGAFENLFVSFAHSEEDIKRTLIAADEVAAVLRAHA